MYHRAHSVHTALQGHVTGACQLQTVKIIGVAVGFCVKIIVKMKVFMVILVCGLVTVSIGQQQQQGKRRRVKKKIAKINDAAEDEHEDATEVGLVSQKEDITDKTEVSDKKKEGRG